MLCTTLEDIRASPELRERIVERIRDGSVFVYPTDTIYGLGCNANNVASVRRIRKIKGTDNPLSVIAPGIDWIKEHLSVGHNGCLNRLPGPYTLIAEKKDQDFLKWVSPSRTLGVRIPNHHFTKFVKMAGVPFVTTSVNVSGMPSINKTSEIPRGMIEKTDVVIDAGSLDNPPSIIIDLTAAEPTIIRG